MSKKRTSTRTRWITIVAIGFIVVFMASYAAQLIDGVAILQRNKTEQTQDSRINIPFTEQGVVSIRVAEPDNALLYTGKIEVANDDAKRAQGLQYRDSIADDQAMLFIFSQEDFQSFWMQETRMPLDIIYINSNGQIVSISKNAKPYDLTSLPSSAPAQFVLEIKGGLSDLLGITEGNVVTWEIFEN